MNPYILLPICLGDILLTYFTTKKYKKIEPKKDWTIGEMNPYVRYCWRKFGLEKGSFIFGVLTVCVMLFIIEIIRVIPSEWGNTTNMIYFMGGAYMIIYWLHINNLGYLLELEEKKAKNKK
jgi:hypothetical protein